MNSKQLGLAFLAVGVLACGANEPEFIQCVDDTSCRLAAGGRCTENPATGHSFCAYPSADCASGMRWSDLDVEESISGDCLEMTADDAGTPDAGVDAEVPDAVPGAPVITDLTVAARVAPAITVPITCTATDPDGDALSYTWTVSSGSFTGTAATIQWTAPATEGIATVTCEVTDGVLGDTRAIDVTVLVTDGLVAGYFFNGDANDFSGNGHDATVPAGMFFVEDRFGRPSGALRFNGLNNMLTLPTESDFDLGTLSIVAIIKPDSDADHRGVVGKSGAGGSGVYSLRIIEDDAASSAGFARFMWAVGAGGHSVYSTSAISNATYTNIVAVRTATNGRMYVTGALVTENTHTGVFEASDEPVTIGRDGAGIPAYFDGDIDEVRIYNRALSLAEVQAISGGAAVE